MFSAQTYKNRRQQIATKVGKGFILITGNEDSPKNYRDNTYPFRQDSNFLYCCGIDKPGLYLGIDCDSGKTILYGEDITIDHIVWMGDQPKLRELANLAGIEDVANLEDLESRLSHLSRQNESLHYLPQYRALNREKLTEWLDVETLTPSKYLIMAMINTRSYKEAQELTQIESALELTRDMHHYVRDHAQPGMIESELCGTISGMAQKKGGDLAYGVILTVNGHTLHNHYHGNILKSGQLILGDFGCETPMHYASDITRTWPVDGKLTAQQKAIYQIVGDAHTAAVDALAPGRSYRDVHLISSLVIATGLKELGLMKGDPAEAVKAGAHALFFPHGLGHMMGLDVHDMEDLGEDFVGYDEKIKRSDQFGLKSLRLGRDLEPGFVLTVEPGVYFIPQLIDQWQADGKHNDFINFPALNAFRNFSGIRLEDNYVITENGSRLLGPVIDK